MRKLEKSEYHPFYQTYINQIEKNDLGIIENLQESFKQFQELIDNLDSEKHMYQYSPEKWTIKDIIQHLIDAERVFNYRALRIARNDAVGLEGFEQNDYVKTANANNRRFDSLKNEYVNLRKNTISLYKSFDDASFLLNGKAGGNTMSVRALGFITAGHVLHHLEVIKNRYL